MEFSLHSMLNCHLTAVVITHKLISSAVISTVFLKGVQDTEVSWKKHESDGIKQNSASFWWKPALLQWGQWIARKS